MVCSLLSGCSQAHPLIPDTPNKGNPTAQDSLDNKEVEKIEPSANSKYNGLNVVGVDHFGRSFSTISAFKKDRQVGMFFWLWIGQPYASDIYDATKIAALPNGVKILTDFNHYNAAISPNGQAHYWGEPLWGYYNSEDEWVIRKQMQMLTTAGVDFIYFDTSNAVIYSHVFLKICAVIDEMQRNGWSPPKIVFYTHSHSFQTVRDLYRELYQPQRFPNTWYRVNGKPLIIAYTNPEDDLREAASRNDTGYKPGDLASEIISFFYFLKPQWPFDPIYPDGFPWIEWTFPQPFHTQSKAMNVTVASHPMVPMSFSLTRPNWVNWGRGWDPTTRKNIEADVDRGTFFQTQWNRAINADPPLISVGGWNEWIAYKQPWDGEYMLCDAANKEYSRDIEPMAGGYQDAFYLQLISNIRRYKGITGTQEPEKPVTIDINGSDSQWDSVKYVIRNMDGKQMARNANGGALTVHYDQPAPANKIAEMRAAHDGNYIYFYLKGKDGFSNFSGGDNWLNIFIGSGNPELKSWESYDFVIGRKIENGIASVDKFDNGFNAKNCGNARIVLNNNKILLAVPRTALGLANTEQFYFKVAMGVTNASDIMDYYKSGSVLPMGRLSYMYILGK